MTKRRRITDYFPVIGKSLSSGGIKRPRNTYGGSTTTASLQPYACNKCHYEYFNLNQHYELMIEETVVEDAILALSSHNWNFSLENVEMNSYGGSGKFEYISGIPVRADCPRCSSKKSILVYVYVECLEFETTHNFLICNFPEGVEFTVMHNEETQVQLRYKFSPADNTMEAGDPMSPSSCCCYCCGNFYFSGASDGNVNELWCLHCLDKKHAEFKQVLLNSQKEIIFCDLLVVCHR